MIYQENMMKYMKNLESKNGENIKAAQYTA